MQQNTNTPKETQKVKPRAVVGSVAPQFVINKDRNEEMINRFKSVTDMCVEGQMKIFNELNIHFDVFTHESDYVYNKYLKIFP